MVDDADVRLFVGLKKMDSSFVRSVINAAINEGSKYAERFGVAIIGESRHRKGSLSDAITTLSNSGGMLWMDHPHIGVYSLAFHQNQISKLWCISLSLYGGNLAPEDIAEKNAKIFINIAKSIWNAIEMPIYGCGDDTNELAPFSGRRHPNDDDILVLNVPINNFWLNFYGKKLIEKFGRKNLEEGAYKVEELKNGILIITDIVPKTYQVSYGWGYYKRL